MNGFYLPPSQENFYLASFGWIMKYFGEIHCEEKFYLASFGWIMKYFEGIHRSTFGSAMNFHPFKERRDVLGGKCTHQGR